MNWQPVASQVTVGAHDLQQRKATMVVVYLDSSLDYSDTIAVEPHSLEPCKNLVRETRGGCLVQTFPYSPRSRNLRIIVDLAGVALEPYQDGAFYNVERDFGRKFDVGRKY